MMKKDGGSAFPFIVEKEHAGNGAPIKTDIFTGMTLRDYFAAKALEGIMANINQDEGYTFADVSKDAYGLAGAMIAERDK